MRLTHYKDKKGVERYYVIKTYYDNDRKQHTKTVESLGTEDEIRKRTGQDPVLWAKQHVEELNRIEEEQKQEIIVKFHPNELITKDSRTKFNIGYLFLQKIYYELKMDNIVKAISKQYKFDYDLNSILSDLIYGRIICPSSKKSTFDFSYTKIEQPDYELHQVYRSLDVISKEEDFLQSELYKNSFAMGKRNTGVIYYDCTNFFFEIEEPDSPGELRQYGKSKENRPLPIVEMGLFIDSDGIPLAMCIHPGNTNEQVTVKPLEEKIMKDYGLSKFVFCADAGLSSNANKRYNSRQNKAFVVTQSIKKLNKELHDWALNPDGWRLVGAEKSKEFKKKFNIEELDEEKYYDRVFYKERWVDKKDFEEKLIVTFSLKYRNYQHHIREEQIKRAEKAIGSGAKRLAKKNANDYRRFIEKISATDDGEIAENHLYSLNQERINEEAKYDGFYAVCTDLDDTIDNIVAINKYRWKIEECFRIMKTDFESRPVYVSLQDRIKAHFITCYLSLVVYRYLEKKLGNQYTGVQILDTLRDMELLELPGEGYIPAYTRTDLTDKLHEISGFRTDYTIIPKKKMKEILKASKKRSV